MAQPIQDLSNIPIPDYSDLDLSQYRTKPLALFVTTSRGCPYHCTFCDVRSIWQSYRLRDPARVVDEIRFYVHKYQSNMFIFTDSLLNGNMDHYRSLLTGLTQLREEVNGNLSWDGFCVVAPAEKMVFDDFALLKTSGCKRIKIGVESGSPSVRRHMRKSYNSADLDYFLRQASRAKVGVDFMLMVGYPTETSEDFQMTKDLLVRYRPFMSDGTIQFLRIDITHVSTTQPLYKMRGKLGLNIAGSDDAWSSPGLDLCERLRRYFTLREYALSLGYKIMAVPDQERQALYRRLALN